MRLVLALLVVTCIVHVAGLRRPGDTASSALQPGGAGSQPAGHGQPASSQLLRTHSGDAGAAFRDTKSPKHQAHLRLFDRSDPAATPVSRYNAFLDRNSRFAARIDTVFAEMDADHSGALERSEIDAAESWSHLLHQFDLDHSGSVSHREFKLGYAAAAFVFALLILLLQAAVLHSA